MKWMMWTVAMLVAALLPLVVVAQSGTMAKGDKMDKMEMKDATYTGCIEAGMTADTFTLTHIAAGTMGKDAVKKDTMNKDTMNKEPVGKDAMAPESLALASSSVDLNKHLGHKVAITGSAAHGKMDAMGKDAMAKGASAFTVKSLKMVSASCS